MITKLLELESCVVGLGGGCHWCTEAVFQNLRGVIEVRQGFMKSDTPHDSWSEAVEVEFNPELVPLETLIEIHLRTHASTADHSMRGKYRSAVYGMSKHQVKETGDVLGKLQLQFDVPLITLTLRHRGFKLSDERFQNYYANDRERPFCKAYIDPKLKLLREKFSNFHRE